MVGSAVIVMKFGGTSVGDIARMKHVAGLIDCFRRDHPNKQVATVVSAMAGETNRLVALARSCVSHPPPRELDVVLGTGEQVSVALMAMCLLERGIDAESVYGGQVGIITDARHTEAHVERFDPAHVRQVLDDGKVPVVAGFQGVTEEGELTTLGRGGSDITAVALAAALQAEACYIFTDVPGVLSTDPRVCNKARILPQVCYEEMFEMASLGAKVLHPRSVYFAMAYGVPLVVLSTFDRGAGTWIVREEDLVEKPIVRAVTHRVDEARIVVREFEGGISSLSLLFETLAKHAIMIDMITQMGGNDRALTSLSFTVPDHQSEEALAIARELVPELSAQGVFLDRDIAKVSIVGVGMKYHTGVASTLFRVLAAEGIEVEMIGTSESEISVIIDRKYCELAVRAVHHEFVERANDT